jgi:hypothetical protein
MDWHNHSIALQHILAHLHGHPAHDRHTHHVVMSCEIPDQQGDVRVAG